MQNCVHSEKRRMIDQILTKAWIFHNLQNENNVIGQLLAIYHYSISVLMYFAVMHSLMHFGFKTQQVECKK